jgi:short/branched chain acyl-CoA dehydrogenase
VRRFSVEKIQPHVAQMDEAATMKPEIIKGLFDQGVSLPSLSPSPSPFFPSSSFSRTHLVFQFMGIETDSELSGAHMSFTSAIIVVEELARVDPSVSVLCDVQNTLVNTFLRKYAADHLKKKYLPQLATNKVGSFCLSEASSGSDAFAMKGRWRRDNQPPFFFILPLLFLLLLLVRSLVHSFLPSSFSLMCYTLLLCSPPH